MKRIHFVLLAVAFVVAVPLVAWAANTVSVETPSALDVDEVTCAHDAICTLTDLAKHREVLIQNRTDQILCIEVTTAADGCASVAITCAVDNTRSDDVWPLSAGATLTIPMLIGDGTQLCGKLALADTLTESIYVLERN